MKKTIILSLSLAFIFTLQACAQHISADKVPANVVAAFKAKYPKVEKTKWELENGNYEAGFDLNDVETSVLITPQGSIIETETEIAVSALPTKVAAYVKTNLGDKKIKEASIIIDAKGIKKYEAEVGGKDYVFDENGNFIK
ncbi:MAG: hypothetical protein RJA07_1838 [Bacteroidota bacterium]|jgi:hypothetical protein